tara:strand:- start:868 stop:1077 length:210 start_codon:yes stop_codon:yes gene_type:complete
MENIKTIQELALDWFFDQLVENGIATKNEIKLVILINGYNQDALDSILYARTGYRSLSQYEEHEAEGGE